VRLMMPRNHEPEEVSMKSPKKRPNRKEQRAARQLAKDEGLTYQQALLQPRKKRSEGLNYQQVCSS
jgi:hypothetical protein